MGIQGEAKLVAIVDDDDLIRSALQGMLKSVGLPSQAFASAEEFLASGQHQLTACLIADIRMPGMSGLELQARLNAEHCRIPTIFITAHGDTRMRMQALMAGAVDFMAKPFDDGVLIESVRAALEN
jgi:FixJ family two-component response regulator